MKIITYWGLRSSTLIARHASLSTHSGSQITGAECDVRRPQMWQPWDPGKCKGLPDSLRPFHEEIKPKRRMTFQVALSALCSSARILQASGASGRPRHGSNREAVGSIAASPEQNFKKAMAAKYKNSGLTKFNKDDTSAE